METTCQQSLGCFGLVDVRQVGWIPQPVVKAELTENLGMEVDLAPIDELQILSEDLQGNICDDLDDVSDRQSDASVLLAITRLRS